MISFKHFRRKIRYPFEIMGYKLAQLIIPILPRKWVINLAKLIGKIVVALPISEKKIGLKNLDAVFGETKTQKEKEKILATAFATFALTMMDLFWFSKNSEQRIKKWVDIHPSFKKLFQDKALLCVTAHFGNWEISALASVYHGVELASVAAPLKNKAINHVVIKHREQKGQVIIPREGAMRTMLNRLRKNKKVGLVLDQNVPTHKGGIIVDFMGLPTPVTPAAGALSYRTGTEIFLGFCTLQPDSGHYLLYSSGTIQPPPFDKKLNTQEITQALTQQIISKISEEILNHPELWLWSYKHWRRKPGENYPENYPDY